MKTIKIDIPGSIRSKKNSKRIIRAGKYVKIVPSKAYLAWEKHARSFLRDFLGNAWVPLRVNIWASVRVYYKGRQPDLSGCLESIGDCLEGYIWENDSQIVSWDGSRLYRDPKNPHTIVEVRY